MADETEDTAQEPADEPLDPDKLSYAVTHGSIGSGWDFIGFSRGKK